MLGTRYLALGTRYLTFNTRYFSLLKVMELVFGICSGIRGSLGMVFIRSRFILFFITGKRSSFVSLSKPIPVFVPFQFLVLSELSFRFLFRFRHEKRNCYLKFFVPRFVTVPNLWFCH